MAKLTPQLSSPPLTDNVALNSFLMDVYATVNQLRDGLNNNAKQNTDFNSGLVALNEQISTLTAASNDQPVRALDNLEVYSSILGNFITWGTLPGNAFDVAVYRAAADSRGDAVLVQRSRNRIVFDPLPEGVGDTYYYWVRGVRQDGELGEWNLVNGQVSSAGTPAAPVGINDEQVNIITASKIFAVSLSAISANLGTIIAGILKSPDENFIINLQDKSILIAGPNGSVNDDYTILKNGEIAQYIHKGSGLHQKAASIQTVEPGVCSNGAVVTLSRYYKSMPAIFVSPLDLDFYNAAYASQSQKIQIKAINKTLVNGQVQFTAVAQSILASNNTSAVVNDSSSSITTNTYQSATYTTSANTTSITVEVSFSSSRGTGTSPNWYYRTVQARLAYRVAGSGGAWNYTGYTTVNMNADFATYTASVNTGTITQATWEFFVDYVASDTGGTFSSGTGGYLYNTDTIVPTGNSSLVNTGLTTSDITLDVPVTWPSYSPPSGYTIYEVNYVLNYNYSMHLDAGGSTNAYVYDSANVIIRQLTGSGVVQNSSGNANYSKTETALTNLGLKVRAQGTPVFGRYASSSAQVLASGSSATVKSRQLQTNSTTPSNVFNVVSYALTLATATVTGTGDLQYVAIG